MVGLNTIRSVTVKYASEGADKFRSDADAAAASQQRLGQAAMQTATVTEQASKRQLSAAAAYDKLRQNVDATAKAQAQFDRATRTADRAFAQGVIGAAERRETLEKAQARFFPTGGINDNRPGAGGGLSSYDKSFIRYQGFDVASSLGAGASPLTVAFQQGPQVLQQLADREGGLGAGLKQLGVSALALVNPFTVALGAATALAGGFAFAAISASRQQEALDRATKGVGAATGATAGQLDALARANAEAGKVSTSTAREIAAGYASTGSVALPVLGDLISRTSDYARLTGQEIPAATAELARMFADPAKGAEDLAGKIGGLDDRTRQFIQTQIEQGDRSAAQEALAAALKAQIDANAAATTGWAAAWNTVSGAADRAWESLKRAAGAATGLAPESAVSAVERLNSEVEKANRLRAATGAQPLGLGDSLVAQRDAARLVLDTQEREAAARAAEERADKASRVAASTARALDPNYGRLSELRTQQSDLRDALGDTLTRSKMDPESLRQAETGYLGVTRAIETLTDANGKLVSSEEFTRRGNQLQLDAVNAKTDAEKALVAQRQKAFDLAGKAIPGSDARSQIDFAGRLSLASAAAKSGGSGSDTKDEFDRAAKSIEDRIRRQQEDIATFGMGAAAVARYRTETELLTAAKRAEREITPELSAQVKAYSEGAAAAAEQQEKLRDSMREMDGVRSAGREVFSSVFTDISKGTSAANTFANALGRIQNRMLDLASTSITDAIFGRSGTSGSGFLGSLLGGGSGAGAATAGIGDLFGGSFFPAFANGGIMTSRGPIPLHTYAMGGIATSPQMAIFGEGRGPEAYVPLPDGKRIPVAMSAPANANAGPQAIDNSRTYTIDARGAQAGVAEQITAALRTYDAETQRTQFERGAMARRAYG